MQEDASTARYCLSCNYDLRASTKRCPECGRKFDLADRRSFSLLPRRLKLRRWIFRIASPVLIIVMISIASIAMLWLGWSSEQRAILSMRSFAHVSKTRSILPSSLASLLGSRFAYLAQRSDQITIQSRRPADGDLSPIEELTHLQKITFFPASTFHPAIGNRKIDRADIANLSKLPDLRVLRIVSDDISDDSLASLSSFPKLEELDLGSRYSLSELCFESIGKSRNLRILRLQGIAITKAEQLEQLTLLSELDLTGSEIDDAAMEAISGLHQLTTLRLSGTHISRAGLATLRSLPQLRSLILEPFFDARWSVELKRLSALKQLDLIYLDRPTDFEQNWLRSELPGVHISFRLNDSGWFMNGGPLPDLVPSSQPGLKN